MALHLLRVDPLLGPSVAAARSGETAIDKSPSPCRSVLGSPDATTRGGEATDVDTQHVGDIALNSNGRLCCRWNGGIELAFNHHRLELDCEASRNKLGIGARHIIETIRSTWMPSLSTDLPWRDLKKSSVDAPSGLRFKPCWLPACTEVHLDGSGADDGAWSVCVL